MPGFAVHASRFPGEDLIMSIGHFRHDPEASADMQGFGAFLADDLPIRLDSGASPMSLKKP
jgi:hypothetical protein